MGLGLRGNKEMPTYDYVCEKCGDKFEVFQSMKADKLTDCPQDACDGTVRRLFGTGAGIIFKGGGFYETDYRSDSYKKAEKKDGEAGKSAGKKAEKKDSKSGGGSSSTGTKKTAEK